MAGIAGTNVDHFGFIMDPTQSSVTQDYKAIGINPRLSGRIQHLIGGYRTVLIPAAQMATLNSQPIQIVPAAGLGKLIIPQLMIGSITYNSTAYAANAGGASLIYGNNGAGASTGMTLTQGFFQSTATALQVVQANSAAYLPVNATDVNAPLTLIMAGADPTTGNSDVYVRVYFTIVTVPFVNPSVP